MPAPSEYVNLVFDLWDGWEDGAVIRDAATGRCFDPAKVHRSEHKGEYFNARPAQHHPPAAWAGL